MKYLFETPEFLMSETPEFRQWVEKRKREAGARRCWPLRVLHAWIDGYLSELDHMLSSPVSLSPWR